MIQKLVNKMRFNYMLAAIFIIESGYYVYIGNYGAGAGYICAALGWIAVGFVEKRYELMEKERKINAP